MSTNSIFSRSENVGVFPLAVYRRIRPNDNALSEMNLSNFILSVTDKDSFVVSNSLINPIGTDVGKIQFVVSGYLITVSNLKDIEERLIETLPEGEDSISNIYATITLNITNSEAPYLMGSDGEKVTDEEIKPGVFTFSGVTFMKDNPGTIPDKIEGQYTLRTVALHILTKPTGSTMWKIPANSLLKLDTHSISGIDGGEIE